MDELKDLREKIWEIDTNLVKMLRERMLVSQSIARVKQNNNIPLIDKNRELQVIDHILQLPHDPIDKDTLKELYKIIIRTSRSIQDEILKTEY